MARNRVKPDQHQVRANMGSDDATGPTGLLDARDAFDTYKDEFRKAKLTPPSYRMLLFGSWANDVVPALRNGRGVLMAIDHGVINSWDDSHPKPNYSGDPAFYGMHMIFIAGIRTQDGQVQVREWDSLHDKRRPGIPDGPLWVPSAMIRRAAGLARVTYADGRVLAVGLGRVAGAVIRRSAIK
jgi:hypothetical protein